jgi:hypothetical protein
LFHELAKAEADILQKCFHKPREVLHCEMQRGRTLDSGNSSAANSLGRETDQQPACELRMTPKEITFETRDSCIMRA